MRKPKPKAKPTTELPTDAVRFKRGNTRREGRVATYLGPELKEIVEQIVAESPTIISNSHFAELAIRHYINYWRTTKTQQNVWLAEEKLKEEAAQAAQAGGATGPVGP